MSDNKTISLSFSVGDLPMIAHAFSIARATAMMCGNKIAMKRLDEYHKTIAALIPEAAKIFGEEEWAEIFICIAVCKEWRIGISHASYNWHTRQTLGRIEICVDQRKWESEWLRGKDGYTTDSPEFHAVRDLLEQCAGMDSIEIKDAASIE